MPIESIEMGIRTKTRLGLITLLLLIVSFRLRLLRKTSEEAVKEALQLLGSIPPR